MAHEAGGAVRAGDWKLIEFFEDGKQELYNLKDDIGEEHNLAKENPDKVKELHAKLVAWREKVGAKMPTPNTDDKSDAKQKQAKKESTQEPQRRRLIDVDQLKREYVTESGLIRTSSPARNLAWRKETLDRRQNPLRRMAIAVWVNRFRHLPISVVVAQ